MNPDRPEDHDVRKGDALVNERRKLRGDTSFVGLSSLLAAASGYAIFVVAARVLPVDQNADFLAFWGVLFGLFGVLTGLMHEATRAAKSVSVSPTEFGRGAPIVWSSLMIGTVVALGVALISPWWVPALIPTAAPFLWVGFVLATLLYAGHVGLAGTLGGRENWRTYSALAISESLLRLAVVSTFALLGFGLGGVEIAALTGTLVWLVFAFMTPAGRSAMRIRADVDLRGYVRRCSYSMATATSSAILITGFPALIKLLSDDVEFAGAAPLLLAVSLTRAPILIPLQAFQGVFMTRLIGSDRPARQVLSRPVAMLLLLGAAGGVVASWAGPPIMLLFGQDYRLDGMWLGMLTFDAALLAVLSLTGTAALAAGRHRVYLAGWLAATLVSVALLAVPAQIDLVVICSLAVGPFVGSAVHMWGLQADRIAPPPLTPPGKEPDQSC